MEMRSAIRPLRDPWQGTAEAMVWRRRRRRLPQGEAVLEQTDSGHAGRSTGWEPRDLAAPLQPRQAELRRAAEGLLALLDCADQGRTRACAGSG